MSTETTNYAQEWAEVVRDGSSEGGVKRVIGAVNDETRCRLANRADVIVACAQILGQNIAGEPEVAREIRAAIMEMVDGYAMHSAVLEIRQ